MGNLSEVAPDGPETRMPLQSIPEAETAGVLSLNKIDVNGHEIEEESLGGKLLNAPIEVGKSIKLPGGQSTSPVERIDLIDSRYHVITADTSKYIVERIN